MVEKPLGKDGASAKALNEQIGRIFPEPSIYRIDHYLGKETVQNLMALRFANALFEPVWNAAHIDNVQITVAETLGVEGRAGYYDTAGALRDMVQNHMLQLLCLVAMEPPTSIEADSVRDEKLKVLQSLKPLTDGNLASQIVRGQYRAGASANGAVPGYLEELGSDTSKTETYRGFEGRDRKLALEWRSLLFAFRQAASARAFRKSWWSSSPFPIRFSDRAPATSPPTAWLFACSPMRA